MELMIKFDVLVSSLRSKSLKRQLNVILHFSKMFELISFKNLLDVSEFTVGEIIGILPSLYQFTNSTISSVIFGLFIALLLER